MYSSCIKESADVPSANIDQTMFAPDSVAQTFRKAACGFVDDSLFVETKGALSSSISENGIRLSYIIAIYNSQGKLETSVVDPVSGVPGGMSGFTYPHVFVWNSSKSQFEDNLGFSSSIRFWGYEDDTYTVLVLGNLKGSRSELESFAGSFFSSSKNLSTVLAQSIDMQNSNMFSISSLTSFKRLPSSAVQSGYVFGTSGSFSTYKFFKKYRVRFLKDSASNYVGDSINLDDVYVNQCARYVYPFNTTSASSAVISDSSKSFSDILTDDEKELGFNTSVTLSGKSYLATDYVDIWVPRNIQGKSYSSINSLAKRQRSYLTSNGYSQLANRASSIVGKVNSGDGLYSSYSFEYYLHEDTSFSNFNVNETNDTQLIDILLTKEYLTTSGDSSKRTIKYHWSNGNENSPGSFKTDVISTSGVRCSDVLVIDKFFCDDPSTQLTFKLDAKPSSGSRINGTAKSLSSVQSSSLGGPNSRIGFALPSGSSNVKLINNNKKASLVVNYSGFLTSMDPNEVWYLTVSDGVADPVEIPLAAPWKAPVTNTSFADRYTAQTFNVSWDTEGIPMLYEDIVDDIEDVEIWNARLNVSSGTACTSANLSLLGYDSFYLRLYSKDMVFCNEYTVDIIEPILRLDTPSNKYSINTVSGTSLTSTYTVKYYVDQAWENFQFSYYRNNGSSLGSKFSKSDFDPSLYDSLLGLYYSTPGRYFSGTPKILTFTMQNASNLKCQFYMSSWGTSTSSNFLTIYTTYNTSSSPVGRFYVYPKYGGGSRCNVDIELLNPFDSSSTNGMSLDNIKYAKSPSPSDYLIMRNDSSNKTIKVKVSDASNVSMTCTGFIKNPSVSTKSVSTSGPYKLITPSFSDGDYRTFGQGRIIPRVYYHIPFVWDDGDDYDATSGSWSSFTLSNIYSSTIYYPLNINLYQTIVNHFYGAFEKVPNKSGFTIIDDLWFSINGVDKTIIYPLSLMFSNMPSIKHFGLAPVLLVPNNLPASERKNYVNYHAGGNLGSTELVAINSWNLTDTSNDERYLSNRIMRLRGYGGSSQAYYSIGFDTSTNSVVQSVSVAKKKINRLGADRWAAEGMSCAYLGKRSETTMTAGQIYYVGGPCNNYFLYDAAYTSSGFNTDLKTCFTPVFTPSNRSVYYTSSTSTTEPCMSTGKANVYVINGLFNACSYVGYYDSQSYIRFKANEWFFVNDTQPVGQTYTLRWSKCYNFYTNFSKYTIF